MALDRANRSFLKGLARAFGGALVFSMPMLMTMEMWWLGFHIDPLKLVLLLLIALPLLIGLSHFGGFEETTDWKDDAVDAFVAYGVGFVAATPVLLIFGVITLEMSWAEIIGKIAMQAVPGSIGALLAQSQFGTNSVGRIRRRRTHAGEVFLMAAGAIYLSLNVAPTEEMVLIALKMTYWHGLALIAVSLLLMHAFVYSLEFKGGSTIPEERSPWRLFLRFTVLGYAVCLVISAYILWTFGRLADFSAEGIVMAVVVLSFPAALGAAAARLIL